MSSEATDPAATPDPQQSRAPIQSAIEREQLEWKAKAAAGESITADLVVPVTFGSERVKTLTFRPLAAAELRKFPLTRERLDFGHYLDAAGSMCGRPPQFMDLLSAEDTTRFVLLVELFWQSSRRTGGK